MTDIEIDRIVAVLVPALVAALVPRLRERPPQGAEGRAKAQAASEAADALAGLPGVLAGRERVTVRELAAALGMTHDRATSVRIGHRLRALRWAWVGRDGKGARERVYARVGA